MLNSSAIPLIFIFSVYFPHCWIFRLIECRGRSREIWAHTGISDLEAKSSLLPLKPFSFDHSNSLWNFMTFSPSFFSHIPLLLSRQPPHFSFEFPSSLTTKELFHLSPAQRFLLPICPTVEKFSFGKCCFPNWELFLFISQ